MVSLFISKCEVHWMHIKQKPCLAVSHIRCQFVFPFVSIELQLQESSPTFRNGVYSHLEAFVPCNKDTLIKRLKKLHLNVQVKLFAAKGHIWGGQADLKKVIQRKVPVE